MVQESPGDNRSGSAEGRGRPLGAGAIAALTGGGLLAIFMIQNTEDVKIDFLFWDFTWPLWLYTFVICSGRGVCYGSDWAYFAVIGAARRAAKTEGADENTACARGAEGGRELA